MNRTTLPQQPARVLKHSRRSLWLSLAAGLSLATQVRAEDPQIDAALKLATSFLLSQTMPKGDFGQKFPTAMTSLSILALAACGHQPTEPTPEGQAMRKGLDFILLPQNQTEEGYFGKGDSSRMYGHGITTLMLAEMVGMAADDLQDARIREKLKLAIDLILRAQNVPKKPSSAGGWHYQPDMPTADMSISCWQVMALRAAQNAGLEVPHQAIDNAVTFIKSKYQRVPDRKGRDQKDVGGFGYSTRGFGISTTAEGLLAMQVCGQYDDYQTIAASNHLLTGDVKTPPHLFYTQYYYAQAMYQRGGKYAEASKRIVPQVLLPKQHADGSFQGQDEGGGKVYTASMAILALAVKNHFLHIYQR